MASEVGYSAAWFVSAKRIETPQNTVLFPVRETNLNKEDTPNINHFDEGLLADLGPVYVRAVIT